MCGRAECLRKLDVNSIFYDVYFPCVFFILDNKRASMRVQYQILSKFKKNFIFLIVNLLGGVFHIILFFFINQNNSVKQFFIMCEKISRNSQQRHHEDFLPQISLFVSRLSGNSRGKNCH